MKDHFQVYLPVDRDSKDAPVAAAQVTKENIRQLAKLTGATEVWKKIRGGSMVISELQLKTGTAKTGDYILSGQYNTFIAFPQAFFETKYKLKGPMTTTERR